MPKNWHTFAISGEALHAILADVPRVVGCYPLFLAALLLIGGLGDLYGRRKICGVVSFPVASAGVAARPTSVNLWQRAGKE